jgi:hypothetical protein
VRPIFTPAHLRRVFDQRADNPVGFLAAFGIFPVVNDTHDMVHFSHSNYEGAYKVETGFFAAFAGDFILGFGVFAGDFGDWGEEEVATVGEPVDLSVTRY